MSNYSLINIIHLVSITIINVPALRVFILIYNLLKGTNSPLKSTCILFLHLSQVWHIILGTTFLRFIEAGVARIFIQIWVATGVTLILCICREGSFWFP